MGKITFERPPLIEVSFGLFFTPLGDFRTAHYGSFWSKLRPDFVETADKPLVGEPNTPQVVVGQEWFPLPRVWFVHREKERILQLQPDRFYFNWRRVQLNTPYPRFDVLEPIFFEYLDVLRAFVQEESLGALDVSACELTYTNHVLQGEGWSDFDEVGEVFPDLKFNRRARPQGEPTGFAWHTVFRTDDVQLHVDVKTAQRKEEDRQRPVFILEFRARSQKKPTSADSLREWYRGANATIVSGFLDLTSKRMQKEFWRRVDA